MPTSGAAHDITALDGLRAIAILLVLATHVGSIGVYFDHHIPAKVLHITSYGALGVYLFFGLSGFLLFLPYARSMTSGGRWPSVRTFYLRRCLRILPLYYFAAVTILIFADGYLLKAQNWPTFVLSGLLLQDMTVKSFGAISGPFWTLSIEWQFYLLLPWIAWVLRRAAGDRTSRGFYFRFAFVICTLILGGLWIRWAAASLYYAPQQILPADVSGWQGILWKIGYGVKGKYIEAFALGIGGSMMYVTLIERKAISKLASQSLGIVFLILSAVGTFFCYRWQQVDGRHWIWSDHELFQVLGEWSVTLTFVLLLLGVLFAPPFVRAIFSWPPLRFIGYISYSIYVWHYSLLWALAPHMLTLHSGFVAFALTGVAIVAVFSTASYYMIERPIILRRAASSPSVQVAPA